MTSINPLVAARIEGSKDPWSGVWIAEDIELISQNIKNGNWVDTTLSVVGACLDGLAWFPIPSAHCCSTGSRGSSSTSGHLRNAGLAGR